MSDPTTEQASEAAPEQYPVEEVAAVAPPAPPAQIIVEEADRLRAENLNLKIMAVINRETILQMQLNDLGKERAAFNEQMNEMRSSLEQKYGVNLATHHIQPDTGVVTSRMPQGGMNPQMMQQLQQMQAQAKR